MNTLYKATVIDNLYINQESRDFIDKMQAEGYKYIIKSKNQGYFELEFMVADEIFDGIKNCLIWEQDKIYYNLFDEFLGLYYHGRHHYPNNQYAFKKINKNYMTQENFIDLTEPANQVLQAVYIATNRRNVGGEIPEIMKCSSKINVCEDNYLYTIFDHFFYNIDILELTKLAKIDYYQGHLYEFGEMLNFKEINGKYWQDLTEEAKNIITISLFRNFTNFII